MTIKPRTIDEQIVVLWQSGLSAKAIAAQVDWTGPGVRTRIGQLRALGIPLESRPGGRQDLDDLEARLDLPRLRQLAVETKRGGR